MPHRVIIDCDPGHDDMAAIILAAWHPAIVLEAITTASGNSSLKNTTDNALKIVSAFGLDVPVYRGAAKALFHDYEYPTFHGPSGLDSAGRDLPKTSLRPEPNTAAEEIIRRVEASPGEITLAVVGPMTNIGIALSLRPDLAEKIKSIVFMGGSLTEGNITAAAEFNIWADPEAANIVFRSGARLVMFGLNVTHQTLLTRKHLADLREGTKGELTAVADIMQFYLNSFYAFAGEDHPGAPMHDPCAIAWLIEPDIFETRRLPGEVVISPGPTYGMTLLDQRPRAPAREDRLFNVEVAIHADQERFAALLVPALIWAANRLNKQ